MELMKVLKQFAFDECNGGKKTSAVASKFNTLVLMIALSIGGPWVYDKLEKIESQLQATAVQGATDSEHEKAQDAVLLDLRQSRSEQQATINILGGRVSRVEGELDARRH